MGDRDEATTVAVEEALEELEPGEVEVVRRLVEQEHVGVGGQDGLELCARGLAARAATRQLWLLCEIRDGEARWLENHRSRVGLLEACEHTEQRRLPDSVRTDHADPAAGGDGERDPIEDDDVAEGLAYRTSFQCTTSARHGRPPLEREGRGEMSVSVRAWHGARAPKARIEDEGRGSAPAAGSFRRWPAETEDP